MLTTQKRIDPASAPTAHCCCYRNTMAAAAAATQSCNNRHYDLIVGEIDSSLVSPGLPWLPLGCMITLSYRVTDIQCGGLRGWQLCTIHRLLITSAETKETKRHNRLSVLGGKRCFTCRTVAAVESEFKPYTLLLPPSLKKRKKTIFQLRQPPLGAVIHPLRVNKSLYFFFLCHRDKETQFLEVERLVGIEVAAIHYSSANAGGHLPKHTASERPQFQ